ncbi:Transposable element Tcb2 transposase [Anthophora quadrimaculata]
MHGCVPRKKPAISAKNRVFRLQFAKKFINKPLKFWNTVLFTDESKFEIFGRKRQPKVWRKKNTELKLKNLVSTVKHGGGNIMVWGSMAASGVAELTFINNTMDRFQYLNILRTNLGASVRRVQLPNSWISQQDRDPKHAAKIVKEWLQQNAPNQLNSPPQSPNLNVIENL